MPISDEQKAHVRLALAELIAELRASPEEELENNLQYCLDEIVKKVRKDHSEVRQNRKRESLREYRLLRMIMNGVDRALAASNDLWKH